MAEIEVKVLFFGKARELMGVEETKMKVSQSLPYQTLKDYIFRQIFKELGEIEDFCILAVDQRYANQDEQVRLTPSSEIAVIPPLSGG